VNNAADTPFDLGPLTWVKGEIDQSLAKGLAALTAFAEQPDLPTQLKHAQTHIHQAAGAVQIVGLDGAIALLEEVERHLQLLEGMAPEAPDAMASHVEAIGAACRRLSRYLNELTEGEPPVALKLYPEYETLARLRGSEGASPTDLFYPDLTKRPARAPDAAAAALGPGEIPQFMRNERRVYQQGLLAWLRGDPAGLASMQKAIAAIERAMSATPTYSFWWSVGGFLASAASEGILPSYTVKQLCARIDLQIRRFVEGSTKIADRLRREVLYHVAISEPTDARVRQVQALYGLTALLPRKIEARQIDYDRFQPLLKRAHELIVATKDGWMKATGGRREMLGSIAQHLAELKSVTAGLHEPALSDLVVALEASAIAASRGSSVSDVLAMEFATGVLLAEDAVAHFARLSDQFPKQVLAMRRRLDYAQRGVPSLPSAEEELLDETAKRAQERMLLAQVAREIQGNLRHIEKVLDAFFRDPGERAELANLATFTRQIQGALHMLSLTDASDILARSQAQIDRYAAGAEVASEDLERLAESLSGLGFYIEAVEQQRPDAARLLEPFLPPRETAAPESEAEVEEEIVAQPDEQSIESTIAATRESLPTVVARFRAAPQSPAVRAELNNVLQALKQDAELVGDHAFAEAAADAIAATGDRAMPAEELLARLDALTAKPEAPATPAPSAETIALLHAGEATLDAELSEIFLAEAAEVLAAIAENRARCEGTSDDFESLRSIRRGFHTLKGSGRMVGLHDLGETAYTVEKVFNRWLDEERPAVPELLALVREAEQSFGGWVARLQATGSVVVDDRAVRNAVATLEAAYPALVEPQALPMPKSAADEAEDVEQAELAGESLAERMSPESAAEAIASLEPPMSIVEEASPQSLAEPPAAGPPVAEAAVAASEAAVAAMEAHASAAIEEPTRAGEESATAAKEEPIVPPGYEAGASALGDGDVSPMEEATAPALEEATSSRLEGVAAALEEAIASPLEDAASVPHVEAIAAPLEEATASRIETATPSAAEDVTATAAEEAVALPVEEPAQPFAQVTTRAAEDVAMPALEHAGLRAIEHPAPSLADAGEPPQAARTELPVLDQAAAAHEIFVGDVRISAALYRILLEETAQLLDALRREHQVLEFEPSARPSEAMVRAAHTLGGFHRTAGFPAVADVAQALESTLLVLQHEAHRHPSMLAVIADAAQAIAELVDFIGMRQPFGAPALQHAEAARSGLASLHATSAALRSDSETLAAQAALADDQLADEPELAANSALEVVADEPVKSTAEALTGVRDELDRELLPIFLDEAQELFPRAGGLLRDWRRAPSDGQHARELRRTLHTLKGSARMAGAMRLGEVTHLMESRLLVGDREVVPSTELFEALDSDLDQIAAFLDALQTKAPRHAPDVSLVATTPTAEAPAAEPAAAVVHDETVVEPDVQQRATVRVRSDVIDRLVNESGEVAIARARIEGELRALKANLLELTNSVIRLRGQVREIEIQAETQIQSRMSQVQDAEEGFDPLEFDRYTRFQELSRGLAEGVNDVATVQQALLKNLDDADAALLAQARLSREVQQQLLAVRTVPFASLSERLYRLLRQTAKELDKKANLEIRGGQTELDRGVLEKLVAPLEHLVRNALDHGLESREARVAAGKPETGEITISVRQEGNEIALALSDDGPGLPLESIRAKAVSLGMFDASATPTQAQLVEAIFAPGFTTAHEVTQISGRGIGMDVVKNTITRLGGRVEVTTAPGRGTTFMLYLPLTLAVAQAVLVRAAGRIYALPAVLVEQVQQVKSDALDKIYAAREVRWQTRHYPFFHLPQLLGDSDHKAELSRYNPVLLLRSANQFVAVHVDEMLGNQEIVIKNIGAQLARLPGLSGATVLGTGEIVLILNPVQLAARHLQPHQPVTPGVTLKVVADDGSLTPRAPAAPAHTPYVLVVDDSLTVRKITSRLLVREGFEAGTARDGVDALQMLAERMPDIILLDIEMPRMDGFEFAKTVKSDPKLGRIPIVMITSRTAQKHRARAAEIGVEAYLGKPYQEDELLKQIRELIGAAAAVPAAKAVAGD
jgi:chemosensory pili system protein ChpA (sensor histidine kinase/response regulator)